MATVRRSGLAERGGREGLSLERKRRVEIDAGDVVRSIALLGPIVT